VLRRIFSFPIFLGGLLLAASVLVATSLSPTPPHLFAEGDTWWHIVTGERILSTGTWPTTDSFSFTVAGHNWIAYEWLGEVVMTLAARGGLPGLAVFLSGLSAAVMLLLYYLAYVRSGNVKAAFVACALLLPEAAAVFTPRPQLMGYLFLTLTLIALERFRLGRPKLAWFLPGLFLIWVNTHGTFVLGLLVLGLYWVSGLVGFRWGGLVAERWNARQRRQLAIIFLGCVLVLSATPYGTRLAAYPLEVALLQPTVTASYVEWQPILSHEVFGPLFLASLLLFLFAQVTLHLSHRLEQFALLLFAVYLAATHARFILFFVLVFAPTVAALLARWLPNYQPAKDRWALNAVLLVLALSIAIALFPSREQLEKSFASNFPVNGLAFLRQHHIAGPLLNESHWGGFLIWAGGPERKVFIDGRADIYQYAGVLSDYLRISQLDPKTLFLLRKYGIEACLIRHDAPLGAFLAALPDWKRVYSDDLGALYVSNRRQAPAIADSSRLSGQVVTSEPTGPQSAGKRVNEW
jgi:hypothetical protein